MVHTAPCTQGDIRIQGGSSTRGRVEICNTNVWGTVCDDAWGTPDAQVACRQLGFNSKYKRHTSLAFALILPCTPASWYCYHCRLHQWCWPDLVGPSCLSWN